MTIQKALPTGFQVMTIVLAYCFSPCLRTQPKRWLREKITHGVFLDNSGAFNYINIDGCIAG